MNSALCFAANRSFRCRDSPANTPSEHPALRLNVRSRLCDDLVVLHLRQDQPAFRHADHRYPSLRQLDGPQQQRERLNRPLLLIHRRGEHENKQVCSRVNNRS